MAVLEKELFTCRGPSLEKRGSSSSSREFMFKLKPLQERTARKTKGASLFSQLLHRKIIIIFIYTATFITKQGQDQNSHNTANKAI